MINTMSKALPWELGTDGEDTPTISLPGVTFTVFMRHQPATGEHEIMCVLNDERDYFKLELQAQRRGKSVQDHLYSEMLPLLKAHGLNTPPDCFFVTSSPPDEINTGISPANRVTLQ